MKDRTVTFIYTIDRNITLKKKKFNWQNLNILPYKFLCETVEPRLLVSISCGICWIMKCLARSILYPTNAVFTLGQNMFSLITNETCFTATSVHIRQCIARIMIKTHLFWAWLKLSHVAVSISIRRNTKKQQLSEGRQGKSSSIFRLRCNNKDLMRVL